MGICQSKKAKIEQGQIVWTGLKINAKKSRSTKLWTSRAFSEHILRFVDSLQQTQMQALNRVCYNLCVKQSQARLAIPLPAYLTWNRGYKFKSTLFVYKKEVNKLIRIKDKRFDF